MRQIGRPQYRNPIVQDASDRLRDGRIELDELRQIAETLNQEDAALIGGLIESVLVLQGLGNPTPNA